MTSNDRPGLSNESPRADAEPQHMQAESIQYKEMFYALREKFEHVTAIHRDHETALETAQSKLKNLQAECDMLLDTIAMHVPSQPPLLQYLEQMHPASVYISTVPHPETSIPMTAPQNGASAPNRAHHHAASANGHAHEPQPPHVSRHDAR